MKEGDTSFCFGDHNVLENSALLQVICHCFTLLEMPHKNATVSASSLLFSFDDRLSP
jgi:hypothetical protein